MTLDRTQDAMSQASALMEPFNRRDFDAMIAMSGGSVDYTDVALGLHITDADDFRAAMQGWVSAFSDLHATVLSAVCDGDLLAYEARFEGTHDGPLQTPMGAIPPSGRRVANSSGFFVRLDGDRVAEVRDYSDTLTLLAQIGAIPAQEAPADAATVAATT
jgi:predicted ester cyclase